MASALAGELYFANALTPPKRVAHRTRTSWRHRLRTSRHHPPWGPFCRSFQVGPRPPAGSGEPGTAVPGLGHWRWTRLQAVDHTPSPTIRCLGCNRSVGLRPLQPQWLPGWGFQQTWCRGQWLRYHLTQRHSIRNIPPGFAWCDRNRPGGCVDILDPPRTRALPRAQSAACHNPSRYGPPRLFTGPLNHLTDPVHLVQDTSRFRTS